MKSVLISIKPKWCELIANGKKTIEVRKTKPKCDTPFRCYIYQTVGGRTNTVDIIENNLGKIIGEFVCRNMTCIQADIDFQGEKHLYNTAFIETQMCLTDGELFNYIYDGKRNIGWAWGIYDLVIYDKPKELEDFASGSSVLTFSKTKDGFPWRWSGMTRPPQSWCYVEEIKNDD